MKTGDIFRKLFGAKKEKIYQFTAAQYYEFGEEFMQKEDWENAKAAFTKVKVLEPNNYQALNMLGVLALKGTHHSDAAIWLFKQVNRIAPVGHNAYNNLGLAWQKKGRHKVAKRMFELGIHFSPDDHSAYLNLGVQILKEGDTVEAMRLFEKCLELEPSCAEALEMLNYMNAEDKNFVEARRLLERAVELDPALYTAHSKLGAVLAELNEYTSAVKSFERAVALCPLDYWLRINLGICYRAVDRSKEAIQCFEMAITMNPDLPVGYFHAGQVYAELGELGKTIMALKSAASRGDGDAKEWLSYHGYGTEKDTNWN